MPWASISLAMMVKKNAFRILIATCANLTSIIIAVALRQLSVCQNSVNFLPYTSLPRKSCETKAAFISAILQNSSLHWMLSRQCNLTSADLGIIETSLSRNLRNSRLSQDKRKAKPSLDWADMQHLAIRSSIAATVCEKNFYEVARIIKIFSAHIDFWKL